MGARQFRIVAVLCVFLFGCTSNRDSSSQRELASSVDYFRAQYADSKIKISTPGQGAFVPQAAADGGALIPAGVKIAALVDNRCLDEGAASTEAISTEVSAAGHKHEDLPVQVYEFTTDREVPLDELVAQADSDDCLIGLSESREVQAFAIPNDPAFAGSSHHNALNLGTGEGWDWFYNAENGINQDVIVAVVDTGIRRTHQDLAANIYLNADGQNGYDFINNDADPSDDNGHGTHCAGIIGATANNAVGGAGVIGTRVKLMGVKVLGANGSGTYAAVANGINYAVQNGARVINLSLGVTTNGVNPDLNVDPNTTAAIQNAAANGVVVVIAAGNENANLNVAAAFPANLGHQIPGAITVGSLDTATRTRSIFSNYSTLRVEVFAPGSESSVTPVTGIFATYHTADNAYARLQGTSMAAPMVSGAAALVIAGLRTNGITPTAAQVEAVIDAGSPNNPNLNGLGKGGKTLRLRELAAAMGNQFPAADPQKIRITSQPVDVTVAENGNAQLSVTATTFPPTISYQWQRNGVNIPGATQATLSLAGVTPEQWANYNVLVGNGFRTRSSAVAVVNVLFSPRLVTPMQSFSGQFNTPFTLNPRIIANPAPRLQWMKDGTVMSGKVDAILSFGALQWNDAGTYTLRMSNSQGSSEGSMQLSLNPGDRPIDGGVER